MTRARDVANVLTAANVLSTDIESAAAISAHTGITDPHPAYLQESTFSANQIVYKNASNEATGSANLTFSGSDLAVAGTIRSTASAGDEGGEIFLNKSATNTTLTGGVVLDVNQNRLRFFEQGGTNRGYYLDMASAGAGVATNLGSSGGMTLIASSLNTSGTTSVNFNSISQSYNNLVIYIANLKMSASGQLTMRLNDNNVSTNYYYNTAHWAGSTASFGVTSGVPILTLAGNIASPTGRLSYGMEITIKRYASASSENTQYSWNGAYATLGYIGYGTWSANSASASNTAVTSINFNTSQTIIAGDFYVYGVK